MFCGVEVERVVVVFSSLFKCCENVTSAFIIYTFNPTHLDVRLLNIWLFIQKKSWLTKEIWSAQKSTPAKWWSSFLQALTWTAVCRQLQASCGALPSPLDPDWIMAEHLGTHRDVQQGLNKVQYKFYIVFCCKNLNSFFQNREKKMSFFIHYLVLVMASLRWRFNHSGICRVNNVYLLWLCA